MKSLFPMIGLALLGASALADTTRLTCDLEVNRSIIPSGLKKTMKETAAVEIKTIDSFTSITLDSPSMSMAVTNAKGAAVSSFVDNSNASRWDISDFRPLGSEGSDQQQVSIDRSTWKIEATHRLNIAGTPTKTDTATGACEKTDATKRQL